MPARVYLSLLFTRLIPLPENTTIMKKLLAFVLACLMAGWMATSAYAAVDVNKADAAQLDTIKGIGPAIAAKIADERKKAPFKDWDDLVNRVSGIGDKTAAKLSEAGLTVNGATFKGMAAKPAAAAAPATTPAPAAAAKPVPAAAPAPAPMAAATPAAPVAAKPAAPVAATTAAATAAAAVKPADAKAAAPAMSADDKKAAAKKEKEDKAAAKKAAKEDKAKAKVEETAAKK